MSGFLQALMEFTAEDTVTENTALLRAARPG